MKITYDPKQNVAYIRLSEKKVQVDTIHVSDQLNIDLSPDGTVYGIELLNANEQLLKDKGTLVLDIAGKKQQLPLSANP